MFARLDRSNAKIQEICVENLFIQLITDSEKMTSNRGFLQAYKVKFSGYGVENGLFHLMAHLESSTATLVLTTKDQGAA